METRNRSPSGPKTTSDDAASRCFTSQMKIQPESFENETARKLTDEDTGPPVYIISFEQ